MLGESYAIISYAVATETNKESLKVTFSKLEHQSPFAELVKRNPILRQEFRKLGSALEGIARPCNLCLISGGETTVTVKGEGQGGRNQELALAFSLKLYHLQQQMPSSSISLANIALVAFGTDGQDGPTDAAGAIGQASIVSAAMKQGLDAEMYLKQSDSYSFFSMLDGGRYHIKTGLTGTNVMDLHLILFITSH